MAGSALGGQGGIGGTPAGQPLRGQGGIGGTPAGQPLRGQGGIGGTPAGMPLLGQGGIGGTPAGHPLRGQGGIAGTPQVQYAPQASQAPLGGGKGGFGGGQPTGAQPQQNQYAPLAPQGGFGGGLPAGAQPQQNQYAPLAPQGNFNVNQAAAGGLQQAMQGTQQAMGFQPQQISAQTYSPQTMGSQGYSASTISGASPIQEQTVQAGQVANTDLNAYTNKYEDQVVQQSLGDLERSRQMQQNVGGAQATASGAFGGSRHGIAEAETNRAFADEAARTASGLRQSGFENAQQLAAQDIDYGMQAGISNQGANLTAQGQTAGNMLSAQIANQGAINSASQFGAGAANTAAMQNQNAYNQAGQYNAGAMNSAAIQNQNALMQANQQRLAASNQMGALGQQAFNTGQTIQQNQMQQGLMQQGLQQALIDAASGQYAGYTGAPGASLSAPLAALGVAGPNSGSTTTNTSSPSLFDYMALGFGAYASDQRLKTNIKPRGEVGGFKLYDWDWNDEGKRIADSAQPTFGVMADELQETHPHLVKRGEDGYLRVNYHGLVAELEAA